MVGSFGREASNVAWLKEGRPRTVVGNLFLMAVQLNYFLVALVDVLGQHSILSQLKELPSTEVDRTRAADIVGQTLLRVQAVRQFLEGYFKAASQDHPWLDDLSPEAANFVRDVTDSEVLYQHFSDTTVISVSLASPENDMCRMTAGILDAVSAVCLLQLHCLAYGFAVRGGVEVGLGTMISDREVYGPVLSTAHHLESSVAGCPRIVAGPELMNLVEGLARSEVSSAREEAAIVQARMTLEMLRRDEDDFFVTDFAGSRVHFAFSNSARRKPADTERLFKEAVGFAERQKAQFEHAGNFELTERYAWLVRYLHSRREIWEG